MMSPNAIRGMSVMALLLLVIYIPLAGLHLLHRSSDWIEYCVLGAAIVLAILSAFARLRRRVAKMRAMKTSQASLLKHLWELRHRREW